jgi:NAD(P)-dependent dehydrogenase (short-subunit alcohol dehydrogenase family)
MHDLSLFDLSGRTALVTGGAGGVGRAAAFALARAGADVAVVDLNEDTGRTTVAALEAMGRGSTFVRCDVTDAEQVDAMVDAVVRRFGRLDIAVNNAGIYRAGPDETQEKHVWDQVINVNLTGTWLCARAAMRQMARQDPAEGKIINVASIAASVAASNGSYDASKAGVVQLTRTLAARWGRYNINVNSVSPGYVIAAMGTTRPLEERRVLREMTPLGHAQRLEDLYGAFVFLAARASDYVTGQNLTVDGGHTLSTWKIPLERSVPPRVGPAEEVVEMNRLLDARGISHDDDGVILD